MTPTTPDGMVPVPLLHLEIIRDLREQTENHLSAAFKASLDALIECIPAPVWEPDPAVVTEFAITTDISRTHARQVLIDLHARGLTVHQTEPHESKE